MTASPLAPSSLAAPPAPPIPTLDRPLSPDELERALGAFHSSYHVQHPFHRMMHEGTLTPRQLKGWVANRLAYQRAIPRKDAAIISHCPLAGVRRMWMQRIVDHDGVAEGEGGIELWIRLGQALGVPREEMDDERHVLPAVRMAAESYVTFCQTRPWIESVASSLTELFAPDIMHRRLAAFPAHYPWVDAEGLAYFRSRLVQAPRDSRQAIDVVRRFCTTVDGQRRAFEALAFKITMLWVLVDAIHNAYREE